MLKTCFAARHRGPSIALLFVLTCATAGVSQERAADSAPRGWPREFEAGDSHFTVYEPQLETLRGGKMVSRAAVSVTRPDADAPVFGAVWINTALSIDSETKIATPILAWVTDVRFPNVDAAEAARLRQDIGDEIGRWKQPYSLDALLAELRVVEEQKAAADELKADVPKILFRTSAAVLIEVQGPPAWRKAGDGPYERLENSAAFVVRDPATGTSYLHVPPFWWTSTDPLGSWQSAGEVPAGVVELWKKEPQPPAAEFASEPPRPDVIAVSGDAELVWTDGAPQYAPITGTNLLYIRNTDSDVFLDISNQYTYALLSGRWFRRPPTTDSWEFVASDKLPSDFARIPLSSEKRHVLACVAGTPQAQDAVRNTQVPQTEAVKTGAAPELKATYDGEPQFTPVSDIGVQYAVNTPSSIFWVDNRYYWCNEGIWYDSSFAIGPWFVCMVVPRPIYLIPPSCPHYYVTYCHVFGGGRDVVYVGYYPGYLGCYAWHGSVVFGTGWHYRPWTGSHCYTRPVTWGVCAHYDARSGDWSLRSSVGVSAYRRSTTGQPAFVHAGVGGSWGGVGAYRNPSAAEQVVTRQSRPNLYERQPERIAPSTSPGHAAIPRVHPDPDREPRAGSRTPPPIEKWEPRDGARREPGTPSAGREHPQPTPPPVERRDPPPVEREPGHTPPPRDLPGRTPPQGDREAPRTPPPQEKHDLPPREVPRRTPPPEREAPKQPPPAPHREAPPPPREAPKPPPPPPPQQREAPHREQQREQQRSSDRRR